MSIARILIAFAVLILPVTVRESYHGYVFWNVGQGQWITYIDHTHCLHFDMGGEGQLPRGPIQLCRNKKNELFLTHFDWDHIRFAAEFSGSAKNFCWRKYDQTLIPETKKRYMKQLRICEVSSQSNSVFAFADHIGIAKSNNDRGHVYVLNERILMPGDQSKDLENDWVKPTQSSLRKSKILAVPHHGSRHSSGPKLLAVGFELAIISARKKRYGHPHTEVLERLKAKGIPQMSTEFFGSIFIPADW